MSDLPRVFMVLALSVLFLWPGGVCRCGETVKPAASVIDSMEFREVDIKDILRQLAKQYDLNIVFSENVKGLVTVQLNNVSIDQALESIITVNGFAYTKKDNVYKVTTREEAEKEGKQTKLFKLNNAEAVKLKDTFSKVLSSTGSIEADSRSNSIVVTDSTAVINKIEGMIPALDESTPQVLIEAKLVETSLTSSEKLGIDWTTTVTATGAAKPLTFPFNNAESKKYANITGGNFTMGTLDFTGLSAVFNALESRSNTKLIASPRIMTLNNQKATINVGQVVPVATYQRNDNTGTWEVTGWDQVNIGINLEVTPQISSDGHIKLVLKPEVSDTVRTIAADTVNERPVIATRKAETEVLIKDGQTVVIGGLVKKQETKSSSKVPFLGDIPLIGRFFSYKASGSSTSPDEKTDLLIFVTAHIIKDGDGSAISSGNNIVSRERPFKLEPRGKNAQ